MRIGTLALVVTSPAWLATPGLAQNQRPASPVEYALRFFDDLAPADVDAALRAVRTVPITPRERDLIRATLPASGELTPTADERRKMDALEAVLIYHERAQVFDIKVIDVPQAFVGLHGRAVLLFSRPALRLLSTAEVQALAAHEVGHDFLWGMFEQAQRRSDKQTRQQLELQCDGIAALTLVALGQDPKALPAAVKKLQRFNERLGAANAADYPTLQERERFVSRLLARQL